MAPARATVVTTSPRSALGELSWAAWSALQRGPVLTADAGHRQLPALAAAGVAVRVVADPATGPDGLVWLAGDDGAAAVRALRAAGTEVEVVAGSTERPGERLLDVVDVMDRLRSPGGCPWDAEQTHRSLMPYLLEEAYEAYAALEDGDGEALREELGDVLLQVVFHARLAQEGERPWSVDDLAGDLVDKLVRRHPHVFAGAPADDLEGSWEALKRAEKGRTSVTEGVPLGQPALSLARKLQARGTRAGAPVPVYGGLGGRLWELVREARAAGADPEAELRAVARRYRDALAEAERSGADLAALAGDR